MARSSFRKNLANAVPPRARVMIITGLVLAGFCGYLVIRNVLGGSAPNQHAGIPGRAQVSLAPPSSDISRATVNQKNLVPKGSPMQKKLEKIRNQQISKAQKSGKSYFDGIQFNDPHPKTNESASLSGVLTKAVKKKTPPTKAKKPAVKVAKPVPEVKAKPIKRKPEKHVMMHTVVQQLPISQTMLTNQATQFITQERQRNQLMKTSIDRAVGDIISNDSQKAPIMAMNSPGQSASNSGQGQSGSVNGVNPGKDPNGFYNAFQTPASKNVSVTQQQINQFRHPELNSVGLGNGVSSSAAANSSSASSPQSARYPTDVAQAAHNNGVVINTARMFYAYLQNKADSDSPAPLFATIIQQGPLQGAKLVSTQGPKRVGDKIIIKFDKMALGNKTYSINALAINPKNYSTRLADSVNYHTFARYFKLGLAAFATGYANALSGTTTTINTNGSQTQQVNPLPSAGDQVKVALGTVGEKLLPSYERYFNTPPTVIVHGHRPIGIIFMSPVTIKK